MNDKKFSFFDDVYALCELIPYGKVTTYGAIARYIGSAGAARMVGWAMNASHYSHLNVPAHRVVNRKGILSGKNHFGNPVLMQQLLEQEGLTIIDDKIIDFEKYFWDPNSELKL